MTSVWTLTVLFGGKYDSTTSTSQQYQFLSESDARKAISYIKSQADFYIKDTIILETVVAGV